MSSHILVFKQYMMKGKRPQIKPNELKILEGESEKLKNKLEHLKEQIKIKKQEKQMNRTTQSIGAYPHQKESTQNKMNRTQYSQKEGMGLAEALAEMKIQNVGVKLKDRNVVKLEHLLALKQEEIDKWKDIPVGYRIKLKKYIEKNRTSEKVPELIVKLQKSQEKGPDNIEQIIKNRKAEQVFVPIERRSEEESGVEQQQEIEEEEQQKMMISLMQFLGGKYRVSSLKKNINNTPKKVRWSPEVDQMERSHPIHRVYPKEVIKKDLFHQTVQKISLPIPQQVGIQSTHQVKLVDSMVSSLQRQLPNYKYCWGCLKRINQSIEYSQQERQFCSDRCLQKYQATIQPNEVIQQISQTETKYNQFLLERPGYRPASEEQEEIDFELL